MNIFSSHPSYLGVDIGSAGIKIVELKNEGGRPRLVTYGLAEEPVDVIHNSSPEIQSKAALLMSKICREARVATKKAVAALPSFSVFSSIISLPAMDKKELSQAIYWQAKKFVPLPLEEMTLDWKVLENNVRIFNQVNVNKASIKEENEPAKKLNGTASIKVLIAAAPKKLVFRYIDIFKNSGLELLSLETENFALERALVGGNKIPVMIVDIGNLTSDISIVENGIPLISRSVDSGGAVITKAIMNSLHIDEKRAEQFKRDIGFSSGVSNLPKVIETALTPVINEIKYCFDLSASRQSRGGIEKIILTGGCSFLPNITNYLTNLLNIQVLVGDPWARVIYPVELKPVLDELAPRFSVAVGLAMREIV